ncbi:hypothetical protein BH23ACI1_BH23ACI1_33360 [soil metagenome]
MIAAIYARKSTEQNGIADDQKSVARQVDHARAYAVRKGWAVAEDHVYIDDGISGAEFAARPGFVRLMNALKPRPPFQVLVMSEEARLGREAIETAYALKQLVTAGVRVFFYLEDRERTLDSPMDKIMLSLAAFGDELEREKGHQPTPDSVAQNPRAGHVCGGRVFGYDNQDVLAADGRRDHVQRVIHAEEAAVVRRIFELCAAGKGIRAIAKALNEAHAPAPRAQQGRPKAWAPSSVREVLHRELYRGVIVWNKTRKRDQWGQAKQRQRPPTDWIEVPAPELQVVPDALWAAARERLEAGRQVYLRTNEGRLWGRPAHGIEAKHLLTGLARCGCCGGTMTVRSRQHGKQRAYFYACSSFHHRGRAVCENSLEMRLGDADRAVLDALERELLNPAIIDEALGRAIARSGDPEAETAARKVAIRQAVDELDAALDRLTAALLAGGEAATVVKAMRERELRRDALRRELKALERPAGAVPDAMTLRHGIRAKLGDWQQLLRAHVPVARQMLRKLIEGRIVFTPDRETRQYAFLATGTLAKFFSGFVGPRAMASPAGFEPAFWP